MNGYIKRVSDILKKKKLTISTAESCTGGLLAKCLTDIAGSSMFFKMGVVTYSNDSKIKLLKVKPSTIKEYGAVSEQTAIEMVKGLKKLSNTDICVSITGIAGPDGGSKEKPVGTVYISIIVGKKIDTYKKEFKGNRDEIRTKSVNFVLSKIIRQLGG